MEFSIVAPMKKTMEKNHLPNRVEYCAHLKVQDSQRGSTAEGMGAWCSLDIMLAF